MARKVDQNAQGRMRVKAAGLYNKGKVTVWLGRHVNMMVGTPETLPTNCTGKEE